MGKRFGETSVVGNHAQLSKQSLSVRRQLCSCCSFFADIWFAKTLPLSASAAGLDLSAGQGISWLAWVIHSTTHDHCVVCVDVIYSNAVRFKLILGLRMPSTQLRTLSSASWQVHNEKLLHEICSTFPILVHTISPGPILMELC